MFKKAVAALLSIGALVSAMPAPQNSPTTTGSSVPGVSAPPEYVPSQSDLASGCANVKRYSDRFLSSSESSGASEFLVDAKVAYDCLMSIPLEVEPTLEFLYQLSKFMQFQSTIAYLKTPPKYSGQDPMDILGGLQDIYNAVESGSMTQWYEVETRVDRLLSGCHEGHLYVNWVLPSLINFRAPFHLVSLSDDGTQLPKIYVVEDLDAEKSSGGRFTASAITHIDGQNASSFIEKAMYYESSQSPDTRFNAAFQSQNPPKDGSWYIRTRYPGTNTFILTFENGTSVEYGYNAAAILVDGSDIWASLTTGQDIYDRLVKLDPSASTSSTANKLKARSLETSHKLRRDQKSPAIDFKKFFEKRQSNGVPRPTQLVEFGGSFPDTPGVEPYIQDIYKAVGGYFMDDYENDGSKTAILDITGFAPDDPTAKYPTHAVQAAVELFLKECKKRGMEKLIIDVRGNGGGYVNMGYDMYKQLFPAGTPYSGTRLRYHPASLKIAQAFTQLINQEVIDELIAAIGTGQGENLSNQQSQAFTLASYASLSSLDQYLSLDEDGKPFTSFEDFFGPVDIYNDQFTNILTYPLNNLIAVGDLSYDITGYGDRASYANNEQPFAAEDIILVTDGTCASTCGIFSEFLRNQHGVRTVVIGGRPNNEPSAAVGGTRGTQIIQHSQMLDFVKIVDQNFYPRNQAEADEWEKIFPQSFPINVADAAVNWKDNIRRADPTQTPLQFYLEAADCRLFYTKETLIYSHDLWNKVDALAWGADDNCAWGSLKNATVVTGDSNGVPISIGSDDGEDVGFNSGDGISPQLTGDKVIDTGKWIWFGVRNSLGAAFGRRGY
ncbi:hypothetical protein ABW19_dt0205620 [Dactylella cylindrospora]|nr:hypothetical protein ABW19_dt0205620 [Dactylella cylindrospora]